MAWIWTSRENENFRGAELLCDRCNKLFNGGRWWYGRYEKSSMQPYMFVCNDCKEGY